MGQFSMYLLVKIMLTLEMSFELLSQESNKSFVKILWSFSESLYNFQEVFSQT